jgi:hypothetical protein
MIVLLHNSTNATFEPNVDQEQLGEMPILIRVYIARLPFSIPKQLANN